MDSEPEVRIKRVECGICETSFSDGTVSELAKQIARHWNQEHGDEFLHTQPYDVEEYCGEHFHGDQYLYRRIEYYITAYDVIDPSGEGPFAYEYTKKPEADDVCEDCWRHIEGVDGYREIDDTGWRTKYRCDECHRERQVERRKNENQHLTEFA